MRNATTQALHNLQSAEESQTVKSTNSSPHPRAPAPKGDRGMYACGGDESARGGSDKKKLTAMGSNDRPFRTYSTYIVYIAYVIDSAYVRRDMIQRMKGKGEDERGLESLMYYKEGSLLS